MTNYVYVAESLDGYIADKNRSVKWLDEFNQQADENSDYGFSDFMDKVDIVIMGSNTYEEVVSLGFWPYKKPVCVLSNSDIIKEEFKDKAFTMSGDILDIYKDLQSKGYKDFYVDGGMVIQSFLKHDLIDEMYITKVPTLLGGGISLFSYLEKQISFKFSSSEVFNNSLVKNHYVRKEI